MKFRAGKLAKVLEYEFQILGDSVHVTLNTILGGGFVFKIMALEIMSKGFKIKQTNRNKAKQRQKKSIFDVN